MRNTDEAYLNARRLDECLCVRFSLAVSPFSERCQTKVRELTKAPCGRSINHVFLGILVTFVEGTLQSWNPRNIRFTVPKCFENSIKHEKFPISFRANTQNEKWAPDHAGIEGNSSRGRVQNKEVLEERPKAWPIFVCRPLSSFLNFVNGEHTRFGVPTRALFQEKLSARYAERLYQHPESKDWCTRKVCNGGVLPVLFYIMRKQNPLRVCPFHETVLHKFQQFCKKAGKAALEKHST